MSTDHAPVPGPRPGFKSSDAPRIDIREWTALVATALRALVGVAGLAVSSLYLPPAKVTPILMGVSVMMIVSGSFSAFQLWRRQPLLHFYTRLVWWGTPILAGLVLVLLAILGPGFFGPDWAAVANDDGTVTFKPAD